MAEAATALAHRTLPHNLEAERSVLGAILIDNDSMNVAAAMIDSKAFFRDAHRRIFEKMLDLSERSQPIDLVMLKEELERGGDLEEVGGPAYIASLVDGVPRSTNVEYYAQIVKEKATLRNLIFSANKILGSAYEADQEADLILDEAESSIFAVAEDRIKSGFISMNQLVRESFPEIPDELLSQLPYYPQGWCIAQVGDDLRQVHVEPSLFELAVLSSRLQDRARAARIMARFDTDAARFLTHIEPDPAGAASGNLPPDRLPDLPADTLQGEA